MEPKLEGVLRRVRFSWLMLPRRSHTKLGKRGIVSLPLDLLEVAGIESGSRVWLISDGDILVIKPVLRKTPIPQSTFMNQLRYVFRRFLSR
jgi:bifunctional DNA-binding transcriptional regulator/antitoxin component of YhaV-PrlF toxin-antitoxin module